MLLKSAAQDTDIYVFMFNRYNECKKSVNSASIQYSFSDIIYLKVI